MNGHYRFCGQPATTEPSVCASSALFFYSPSAFSAYSHSFLSLSLSLALIPIRQDPLPSSHQAPLMSSKTEVNERAPGKVVLNGRQTGCCAIPKLFFYTEQVAKVVRQLPSDSRIRRSLQFKLPLKICVTTGLRC
uniref:Uncharacterized protein n=1 Tax=Hyaloperonospora arabidopsidis (strain Emoy2) TaxID=559515 RepID=M4BHQ1_HYAAE